MLITPAELDILVVEHAKLSRDPSYRSADFYRVIASFLFAHICRKGWLHYPSDVKEALELDCVCRAYQELPKYDRERGAQARTRHGHAVNHPRALYRHMEIIVTSTCLNTFDKCWRRRRHNRRTISLSADNAIDVAALETDDVDAQIDEARRAARERTFNERLDMLEALMKTKRK